MTERASERERERERETDKERQTETTINRVTGKRPEMAKARTGT